MLVPTGGGVVAPVGVTYVPPNGQDLGPGALSPLPIEATPAITGPTVLEDDVTFITGPVFP